MSNKAGSLKASHMADDEFNNLIVEAEKLCERRNPKALELVLEAENNSSNQKRKILASYIRAYFECFVSNHYELALRYLSRALDEIVDNQHAELLFKLYMTTGNCYHLKGELFAAQK